MVPGSSSSSSSSSSSPAPAPKQPSVPAPAVVSRRRQPRFIRGPSPVRPPATAAVLLPATSVLRLCCRPSTAIVSPRSLAGVIIKSCARGSVHVNFACTSEAVHAVALIGIVASGAFVADVVSNIAAAAWRAARHRRLGTPRLALHCGARSHYVSLQTCSLTSSTIAQIESSVSLATLPAAASSSTSAPVPPLSASQDGGTSVPLPLVLPAIVVTEQAAGTSSPTSSAGAPVLSPSSSFLHALPTASPHPLIVSSPSGPAITGNALTLHRSSVSARKHNGRGASVLFDYVATYATEHAIPFATPARLRELILQGKTQGELITPTFAANLAEYMLVHVPSIKADTTAIAYLHGARAVLSRDFFNGEKVVSLERGDAMTKITSRIRAVLTARAHAQNRPYHKPAQALDRSLYARFVRHLLLENTSSSVALYAVVVWARHFCTRISDLASVHLSGIRFDAFARGIAVDIYRPKTNVTREHRSVFDLTAELDVVLATALQCAVNGSASDALVDSQIGSGPVGTLLKRYAQQAGSDGLGPLLTPDTAKTHMFRHSAAVDMEQYGASSTARAYRGGWARARTADEHYLLSNDVFADYIGACTTAGHDCPKAGDPKIVAPSLGISSGAAHHDTAQRVRFGDQLFARAPTLSKPVVRVLTAALLSRWAFVKGLRSETTGAEHLMVARVRDVCVQLGIAVDAVDRWSAEVVASHRSDNPHVFRQSTGAAPAPSSSSSSSGAAEPVQALSPAVTAFMESLEAKVAALDEKMDSIATALQMATAKGNLPGQLAATHAPDLATADPVTRCSTTSSSPSETVDAAAAVSTSGTRDDRDNGIDAVLHPSWPAWKAATYAFVNDLDGVDLTACEESRRRRVADACFWRDLLSTQRFTPDGMVPPPTLTPALAGAATLPEWTRQVNMYFQKAEGALVQWVRRQSAKPGHAGAKRRKCTTNYQSLRRTIRHLL
ncbi:Tyr recombinase domain-containing protein [Plasmodiophora brassicae]|uniref:Tyr recombinase domain-containing protein n=1 Tax=Plasmodiophora brassicae TaxID=37360 RepID=A0A0G4IY75_PLABS|nr:hypothetical protein PBRA_007750 [Plasmodiophora brassicae]